MVKRFIVGAGVSMLIVGAAVVAQDMPPGGAGGARGWGGGAPRAITRTEVEAMVAKRFAQLDTDHDGVLTRAELDAARASMVKQRRDRQFAGLDANKDGVISRDEFDAGGPPHGAPGAPGMGGPPPAGGAAPGMWRGRMKGGGMGGMGAMAMMMGPRWFDRADADHDGRLTLAEAKAAALALFDRVDTNHDGTISPEERRAAMRTMMERHAPGMGRDAPPPPQG